MFQVTQINNYIRFYLSVYTISPGKACSEAYSYQFLQVFLEIQTKIKHYQ